MNEDLLIRSLGWGVRKIGKRTLIILFLCSTGIAGLVLGLSRVARGFDLGLLFTVSLFSLFFGWWLARTRQPGWAAAVESGAAAIFFIFGSVGQIGGALLGLALVWLELLWQGWPWREASWGPFLAALKDLWTPLQAVIERLASWISGAIVGGVPFDPVASVLAWSFIIWAAAGWAGWSIRRWGAVLVGMAPAGAILAITLNFTHGDIYTLLLFLTALLLLLFGIDIDRRERRWQAGHIDYPEDVNFDMWVVILGLTLALVSAASFAPSLSIRKMADLVQRLTREQNKQVQQIGESLGLERRLPPVRAFNHWYAPGLPRSHLLGAGPELSQQLVMRIQTGDLPPGPSEVILTQPVPRYYWRGLTYDRYTGRGWLTSQVNIVHLEGAEPAATADLPAYRQVEQQVQFAEQGDPDEKVLFAAGSLLAADQDYQAEWRIVQSETAGETSQKSGEGDSDFFGATIKAQTYEALSAVPEVSAEQLRSAGQDYPSWIVNRYLALPDSVPTRVFALARDLTAAQPNTYDRAHAIETYLRSFPYTLDLPEPPRGRDVVDYFLFDLKRGYCDYYASAMVVLARAAGLPARLVMGYASGQYDSLSASYIVTEANAHSWPEIYFPGYGWIEFEPTAGQPPLERSELALSAAAPKLGPGQETSAVDKPASGPARARIAWPLGAGILIALLSIVFVVLPLLDAWRLRYLSPSMTIAHLYRRLYRHGRQLEVASDRGDTPYEFAASFVNRINTLARGNRWGSRLSTAAGDLNGLAEVYSRSLYSPTPPGKTDQALAIQTWGRLRWRLWLFRLIK